MPFVVGENIGPYRLVEQQGQGGMATVFKAYHPGLDRYVAIKVLHPAFTQEANFQARFQREAQVVARLEHANIVPVYDFAEHAGRPYLVMKYIEGETLKAHLERGRVSPQELLTIVESVGSALAYAHAQGVLHRDVKPSNVLLAKDGRVYLADFGLARLAERGESTISADSILGTPQYISPEQALGHKDLDNRADIYSFGMMLYELMVGQTPFNADTPYSIIHDHIYTPLPLPRSLNPAISEPIEQVLLKALAKSRTDRFSDVPELLSAWRKAIGSTASVATSAQAIQPALQVARPELVQVAPLQAATVQPDLTSGAGQTVVISESQAGRETAAPPRVKKRLGPYIWAGLVVMCFLFANILLVSPRLRARLAALGREPDQPTQEVRAVEPVAQTPLGPRSIEPAPGEIDPLAQIEGAQQAVHQNPESAQAYLDLALAYLAAERPEEARQAIQEVISRAENDLDFLVLAGDLMFERQSWLAAAGLYAEAIRRSSPPLDSPVQQAFNRAMYLAAAAPDAEELIRRLPEDQLAPGIVGLFRGRYALYRGEMPVARGLVHELRETQPGMREIELLETEIGLKNGDAAAARMNMERLVRDAELSPWARDVALYLIEIMNQ